MTKKERDDGARNYIGGTSAPRAKDAAKYNELVNEPKVFSMDNPDVEVFESLPDFLKDIIKGGLEFEGSKLDRLLKGDKPDNRAIKTSRQQAEIEEGVTDIDDEITFEEAGPDVGDGGDGGW